MTTQSPVEARFPVLDQRHRQERSVAFPTAVPWAFVAPHEQQAERNHGQTLRRLAERGGLSPCELVAVLEDRRWHAMDDAAAVARLMELLAAARNQEGR